MALPVLNDKPKYEVKIPSLGKTVRFRPYLVKEEKILLMAQESKNPKDILQAISDTVISCIMDDIDVKKLTTFDIEYLFLIIRSKSVGERAPLLYKCHHCETENQYTINIDDIELNVDPNLNNKIIKLTDEVSLKMKWPKYHEVVEDADILSNTNQSDIAFNMLIKCIESINTEEEKFLIKDQSREEVISFMDSLTADQYNKIREYVEKAPKLEHQVSFECSSCGKHNEYTLQGVQDFF